MTEEKFKELDTRELRLSELDISEQEQLKENEHAEKLGDMEQNEKYEVQNLPNSLEY